MLFMFKDVADDDGKKSGLLIVEVFVGWIDNNQHYIRWISIKRGIGLNG